MADPSVEKLKKAIQGILKGADLDSLSARKVRKMLEEKFDADFSSRKKEIDELVMQMITENEEGEDDDKDEDEDDDRNGASGGSDAEAEEEEEEEEVPAKKAKKSPSSSSKSNSSASSKPKKKKSASKADDSEDPVMSSIREMDDEDLAKKLQEEESGLRRRAARNAPRPRKEREKDPNKPKKPSVYSRPCSLSAELAAVVGSSEMPRPKIVQTLWSIATERNLKDPKNKQFMLCDAEMEALFGRKRVKLFGMMKHLKKHIWDSPR